MSTSSVIDNVDMLGVVVLARHGDRQGDYRNPDTYEDTQTQLTPLGEVRKPAFVPLLSLSSDLSHCFVIDSSVQSWIHHPVSLCCPGFYTFGDHTFRKPV